ncbi:MAG: energy transducer TonB [Melioribacteraceae bacterium]
MKKIISICACLVAIYSCGVENKNSSQGENDKLREEHYLNYDFELDTKSIAEVDTAIFRKEMDKILPAKRIIELFGSGYKVFYLLLEINPDGINYFRISPEASSWFIGWNHLERGHHEEDLEITNEYAVVPSRKRDSKAINLKDFFLKKYSVIDKNLFNALAGILNGKKVRSGKAFQIDISLLANGEISSPWNIKEIDLSFFIPHIKGNQNKENFLGFFPAVLKNDYKLLKDRINIPKEAIERKVSGKLFVEIFFDEDGNYSGYQLIKGLGYGIDEEVIKAIKEFPVSSYPSGEKTCTIIPFNFGISKDTPVDIAVKSFIYNSSTKHKNLELTLTNKKPTSSVVNVRYNVLIYLDNKIVMAIRLADINWAQQRGPHFYYGVKSIKPGKHEYKISIDPEGVLNDVDRSNNIVRGKLVIK